MYLDKAHYHKEKTQHNYMSSIINNVKVASRN